MPSLRDAATLALEALESADVDPHSSDAVYKAIADLQAALAEPTVKESLQVEPVAWMVYTEGGTSAYVTDNPNDLVGAYRALPLYTAPPKRKPLTEEEALDIARTFGAQPWSPGSCVAFARAVEKAHGIE